MMVRPARAEDTEGLATLLRGLTDELPRFAAEPPEKTLERVSKALAVSTEQTLLVTEDVDKITGFIHTHWLSSLLFDGGEGLVSALFIHPDYRRQRLGRGLLAKIKTEGERRGCSRLMLLNMRNRPSYERGFYAKLGWKERLEAANFVYDLKRGAS